MDFFFLRRKYSITDTYSSMKYSITGTQVSCIYFRDLNEHLLVSVPYFWFFFRNINEKYFPQSNFKSQKIWKIFILLLIIANLWSLFSLRKSNKCNKIKGSLELRQCNNDSIQSKNIPVLKLARFFPRRIGDEKERQFQNWNYFWLNGVVLILFLL